MKKATLLLAALLLATGLAAQNPTLYFMEGSTYRSQLNPAFAPQCGYVNLPGIGGMEVGINGNVALDNILYPRNGRLVTLLDSSVPADVALSGLSAQNRIGAETRINLFGIGMFTANHKNFWSFDLALRTSEETTLPRSLFEFLKRGEEGHISDIGLMAESYLEAGFNYSMPQLDDRLYIGFRGKLLVGLARMQMDYDRFDVTLQNDRWAVATHGTIDITADGTKANPDTESGLFGLGDLETSPKGPSGYGLAVDLGATYDILPQLQASLAVTDLGFISWSDRKSVTGVSSRETEFTGVDVPDNGTPAPDFDLELLRFTPVESSAPTRMLRASVNAALEYKLWKRRIGIGLLYTLRFLNYSTVHNITASVNIQPTRWLTFTGSYSALDNRSGAVGLGLSIHPRWLHFFIATDLLTSRHTPQWIPVRQSTAHVTAGIGIPIGRDSHRKAAEFAPRSRKK